MINQPRAFKKRSILHLLMLTIICHISLILSLHLVFLNFIITHQYDTFSYTPFTGKNSLL